MKYFTLRLLDVLAQSYAKSDEGEYWVDEREGGGYTFFLEGHCVFEEVDHLLSFVNFVLGGLPQNWGTSTNRFGDKYLSLTMDEISVVIPKKNKASETKSRDRLFLEHLMCKVTDIYNAMIFEFSPFIEVQIWLRKDNEVCFYVEVEGWDIASNELEKFHRFLLGHSPFRGVLLGHSPFRREETTYYYAETGEGLGQIENFIRRQEDELIFERFQAECMNCNYDFLKRFLSKYRCKHEELMLEVLKREGLVLEGPIRIMA